MTEEESQLLDLLNSVMEADQVALSQAKQSALQIETEVASLNSQHDAICGPFEDTITLSFAEKYRGYLKGQIRKRSIDLAASMAELGAAEAQLRNSFGRYNAFKMYLDELNS